MSEPKTAEVKVVPVPYELLVRARHIIGDRSAGGRMLTPRAEAGAVWNELFSIMNAEPTAPASPPAETGEGEDEARRDAWSDFESDHLTDGKGHAAADVYLHCRFAFDAAWPQGRDGAIAAATAALPSGWPTVKAALSAQPVSPSEGETPRDAQGRTAFEIIADSNHKAAMLRAGIKDRSRDPLLGPPADMTVSRVILTERPEITPHDADLMAGKINAVLRAHPASDQSDTERMRADRDDLLSAWTDFLDANPDGVTSPEEWPDHALVTFDQMAEFVDDAFDRAALAEKAADK